MTNISPHAPPRTGTQIWERSIPSRPDCKAELIAAIMVELTEVHPWVPEDDAHWLELCLEEVVVNAMIHGNQGDPTLLVSCEVYDDQDRWILLIIDHGEGFEAIEVPDPEDPETLLMEHGRGILLMDEWLDELSYYQGGRCAWLSRHKDMTENAGQ